MPESDNATMSKFLKQYVRRKLKVIHKCSSPLFGMPFAIAAEPAGTVSAWVRRCLGNCLLHLWSTVLQLVTS